MFLFSDTQIISESFLEDVNNLLNSGEVPGLFEIEEVDEILTKVRPLCKAAGKIDTQPNIMNHFIQLVRENLHIVLAFSPVGKKKNKIKILQKSIPVVLLKHLWKPFDHIYLVVKNN